MATINYHTCLVARVVSFDTAGLHLLTFRILEPQPFARVVSFDTAGLHLLTFRILEPYPSIKIMFSVQSRYLTLTTLM